MNPKPPGWRGPGQSRWSGRATPAALSAHRPFASSVTSRGRARPRAPSSTENDQEEEEDHEDHVEFATADRLSPRTRPSHSRTLSLPQQAVRFPPRSSVPVKHLEVVVIEDTSEEGSPPPVVLSAPGELDGDRVGRRSESPSSALSSLLSDVEDERPRRRAVRRSAIGSDPLKTPPVMANSKKGTKKSQRQASKDVDEKSASIKELLDKYLLEMKNDHAYIAKNVLAAARMDVDQRSLNKGNGEGGILYDDVSPFIGMKSIAEEITATEGNKRPDLYKFLARSFPKPSTSQEHRHYVPAAVAETPKDLPPVPHYHSYTTLRNNIIAEDDEVMRYFPYFGEDAEDTEIIQELDLEESFGDHAKSLEEEGKKNEYAAMYSNFLKEFLSDLDLSVHAVTHYLICDVSNLHGGSDPSRNVQLREDLLPGDLDLKDPKLQTLIADHQHADDVAIEDLEKCERVCKVFKDTTGMSIWEVVKKVNQSVKDSISPARVTTGTGTQSQRKERKNVENEQIAALTGGNSQPYSLDSYASLSCLLCYMHECPLHVNKDQDRLAMSNEEKDGGRTKKGEPVVMNLATNLPGWSSQSKGAAKDPWGGSDKPCSSDCFLKTINNEHSKRRQAQYNPNNWSAAQIYVLRSSALVLKNNPRCACLIASVVNKKCEEIYCRLKSEQLVPSKPFDPLASFNLDMTPDLRGVKRKKNTNSALPGYPADCDKTHIHEKRSHFQACRHLGACTDACPCVKSHVTCEKSCTCSKDCPRRWRGCSCRREGRACIAEKCMCVKAARECDPDLCHSCGAVEALDPVNRYDHKLQTNCCQNVMLQRDQPRRTLLGRSAVAGFGLFIGEDVKKDQFLGEYKGEVITSEEADRRGKIYDKRGVSFLFNLNDGQVIDATRAGNKFRYVNHSGKRPNCAAKVVMANCTHRIIMYAKRDLLAGEELFFDYGYNNKQVKFVQKEPPEVLALLAEGTPDSVPAGKTASKQPKKMRTTLAYLNGGKGTTERSKARALATASVSVSPAKPAPIAPSSVYKKSAPNLASQMPLEPNSPNKRGRGRPRKVSIRIKSKEYVQDSDAFSSMEPSPHRQESSEELAPTKRSLRHMVLSDNDEDEEIIADSQDYVPDDEDLHAASTTESESSESEDDSKRQSPVQVVIKRPRGRPKGSKTRHRPIKKRRLHF